ncbi:MAG: zinc-binding alcohol dehydrogenase family protein [Chitinophagales bacterium]
MKAIYLVHFGRPEVAFETREIPVPSPNENQVIVKVEAFGLNFADISARNGKYRDCPPLPCVIGYDVVGKVKAVGKNATTVKPGDRVAAMTRFGGYAEYVAADFRGVVKIPEDMPLTFAGAIAVQYCTAYYSCIECVNVHEGDFALVHAAAGGVGTALVQLLKHNGAIVFGTCGSDEKIKYLKSLGVDHPINYRTTDYKNEIIKAIGSKKLDFVFDSVGGKYVRDGIKLLDAGGKLVSYGASQIMGGNLFSKIKIGWQFGIYHPAVFLINSKSLIGVSILRLADHKPQVIQRCLESVVELFNEGAIKPAGGLEFPVEKLGEAHLAVEERKTMGKVMVKW